MSTAAAQLIVAAFKAYSAAGMLFALVFVTRAVTRMDHGVADAPIAMRVLIVPGVTALWPFFAWRWIRGFPPVIERTPHRRKAVSHSPEQLPTPTFGARR